ncbi:TIGR00304 family membrane protein [Methanolobus halotolerans]|nr:DUF131 domain-containing protein [Methanolobus halotolerans]
MSALLVSAGLLMIMLGFLLIFFGSISLMFENKVEGADKTPKTDVKGGGIVMIGPLPIAIGSDNKSVQTLLVLAIVLMGLYLIVLR